MIYPVYIALAGMKETACIVYRILSYISFARHPCPIYMQEALPPGKPTALKNLSKLNHFQTSGAEICCCAQRVKCSAGDVNWMFLECHKSQIIRSTEMFSIFFYPLPMCIGNTICLNMFFDCHRLVWIQIDSHTQSQHVLPFTVNIKNVLMFSLGGLGLRVFMIEY